MDTLAYIIGYLFLALVVLSLGILVFADLLGWLIRHGATLFSLAILALIVWFDATQTNWAISGWVVIALAIYLAYSLVRRRFLPKKSIQQKRRDLGYDD